MTSRTSSSIDSMGGAGFFARQRELFKRRLWAVSLTFLSFLLYHVVGTASVLIAVVQDAAQYNMTSAEKAADFADAIRSLFGLNSFCAYMIVFPIALILALEGFAWMDNRREVDFYESLPVPRGQRFRDICVSSFLYFIFSYIITLEIGLLIAGAMGALSRGMLVEIAIQILRTVALFLAIYGLGVLSAMLTGNVIVAGLAFLTLLLYESIFKLVLQGYCSQFFSTWSNRPSGLLTTNIFDPLYHYQYSAGNLEGPLRLLALAVLYFLLSWICYRLRKNECAGTAVVFGPVRSVVRVAMAVIVGLVVGYIFSSIQRTSILPPLWLALFTVIAACIMQIIYDYDFKALFHRPLEIVLAVGIALLIYLGFLFDVTGYDRFIPDPDKVADAAFICSNDYSYDPICNEKGEYIDRVSYGENYMHLENVSDVIAIAGFGQEYTRKSDALHGREDIIEISTTGESVSVDHNTSTYECTVVYNMKNGKTITRSFRLPSSVDPVRMNAIIGTQAYREGTFSIYHDDTIRAEANKFLIEYTNAKDYLYTKMDSAKYEAFRDAYIRDMEQFTYSFAKENRPIGKMTINYEPGGQANPGEAVLEGVSVGYPVYPSFANTIAFLQENNLWIEPLDYDTLPRWDYDNLSREERDLLDSIDFSILSGPFCPSDY